MKQVTEKHYEYDKHDRLVKEVIVVTYNEAGHSVPPTSGVKQNNETPR